MDDFLGIGPLEKQSYRRPPPTLLSSSRQPTVRTANLLDLDFDPPQSKPPPKSVGVNRSLFVTSTVANLAVKKKIPPPRPPPPKKPYVAPTGPPKPKVFTRNYNNALTEGKPPNSCTTASTKREATLIDFSSPPDSPPSLNRYGSDGVSVNSLSSESSADAFYGSSGGAIDPFGPFDPFGDLSGSRKVGSSLFFIGESPDFVNQSGGQGRPASCLDPFPPLDDISDPFVAFAQRRVETQEACRGITASAPLVQPQMVPFPEIKLKTAVTARPTVIRPKAPVSSADVAKAGGARPRYGSVLAVNSPPQFSPPKFSPPTSTVHSRGWGLDESHIATHFTAVPVTPAMVEGPPPLPPRPISEQLDLSNPYALAEFDFPASQAGDLPFKVGDIVQLLGHVNEEWLQGRCGLKEGIFPSAFVKIIIALPGEEGTPVENRPEISTIVSQEVPVVTCCNNAKVTYTFHAEMPEDLTIYEGTDVTVLGIVTDEWLYGEYHGQRGQFPLNFVDRVPENLPQV